MQRPEAALQRAVINLLEVALLPGTAWTAFPAGGGGELRGAILCGLGLRPGWPDLQLVFQGRYHGIEVKSESGHLSGAQHARHAEISAAGGLVATVRSLDQVVEALRAWRIPTRMGRVF
jgi:hypothetical protein